MRPREPVTPLGVRCPLCHAEPGDRCTSRQEWRSVPAFTKAPHNVRVNLARRRNRERRNGGDQLDLLTLLEVVSELDPPPF